MKSYKVAAALLFSLLVTILWQIYPSSLLAIPDMVAGVKFDREKYNFIFSIVLISLAINCIIYILYDMRIINEFNIKLKTNEVTINAKEKIYAIAQFLLYVLAGLFIFYSEYRELNDDLTNLNLLRVFIFSLFTDLFVKAVFLSFRAFSFIR